MALTNSLLKSMGIEQDQRDQIMAAHQEVLESIKAERDELRDKAAKVPDLENRIQELESEKPTEDWEAKHAELKEQFESFKQKVAQEKADAEKARKYEAIVRELGITKDKIVSAILKDVDFSDVKMTDGEIDGAEEIKEAIAEEWKDFIPQKQTQGASVPNPPDGGEPKTGADPAIVARLKERHERLYGKSEEKE